MCRDFFLHVMVGGDGGVVSPKKLVGWVGTVTDSQEKISLFIMNR